MSDVTPFRITAEELEGLDKKTLEGLQPLLESLNNTLQQLVAAANGTKPTKELSGTFSSSSGGSAFVDLATAPILRARSVYLDQMARADGEDITSLWSWSFQVLDLGYPAVRLLFVGLDASTDYRVTATVK